MIFSPPYRLLVLGDLVQRGWPSRLWQTRLMPRSSTLCRTDSKSTSLSYRMRLMSPVTVSCVLLCVFVLLLCVLLLLCDPTWGHLLVRHLELCPQWCGADSFHVRCTHPQRWTVTLPPPPLFPRYLARMRGRWWVVGRLVYIPKASQSH